MESNEPLLYLRSCIVSNWTTSTIDHRPSIRFIDSRWSHHAHVVLRTTLPHFLSFAFLCPHGEISNFSHLTFLGPPGAVKALIEDGYTTTNANTNHILRRIGHTMLRIEIVYQRFTPSSSLCKIQGQGWTPWSWDLIMDYLDQLGSSLNFPNDSLLFFSFHLNECSHRTCYRKDMNEPKQHNLFKPQGEKKENSLGN